MSKNPKVINLSNLSDFFKEFTEYRNSKSEVAKKENAGDYCHLVWGDTKSENNEPLLKSFCLILKKDNSQMVHEKQLFLNFSQINYPLRTFKKIVYYQNKLATKLEEIWEKGATDTNDLDWNWFLENEEKEIGLSPKSNAKENKIGWWIAGGVGLGLLVCLFCMVRKVRRIKRRTANSSLNTTRNFT